MRKWLILLSYFIVSVLNGMTWATLVPIPDSAMSYYNISESLYTLYSYIFFITSIPTAQLSNWIVAKSLFYSLHITWLMTLIGCWIRAIAENDFWLSFAGQAIVSLPNMMILTELSVIPTLWFPKSQVLLSTSIAVSANFVGMGLSFLVMSNGVSITLIMQIQAAVSTFFFIFNLIVSKSDPVKLHQSNFKEEFLMCIRDCKMWAIVLLTGSVLGVNFGFISLIGLILGQEGYSLEETGLSGFIYSLSGLAGGLVATYLADVQGSTKRTFRVFMLITIVFSIASTVVIQVDYAKYVLLGLFGASITGSVPLGLRASAEYMKNVHESISTNLICLVSLIFSCIYTYPIQFFYYYTEYSGMWIVDAIVVFSYVPLFFVIGSHKEETLVDDSY